MNEIFAEEAKLGVGVRERVESSLEHPSGFSEGHIEIYLSGRCQKGVEEALFYAIMGAARGKKIKWRVPPELSNNSHTLSDFSKGCGVELWAAYTRFEVLQ